MTVALEDVRRAAARLAGVARRTPLLCDEGLSAHLGVEVHAKAEHRQRSGAFKLRGAYNHAASLSERARAAGLVGASSGNHAQALALAARRLGTTATVVVPDDLPAVKRERIAARGATLVPYRRADQDRDAIVARLARRDGLAIVPSSDAAQVVAGAGTVGLEVAGQAPALDVLLVPLGGGGLAAGCATALAALSPRTRVIGVEPALAADTARSLAAGRRVRIAPPATIADGLRHTTPAALPFAINQRLLDDVLTVEEASIAEAMRLAHRHLGALLEPSGAVALAALVEHALGPAVRTAGVVLSGGNVAREHFDALVGGGAPRLLGAER